MQPTNFMSSPETVTTGFAAFNDSIGAIYVGPMRSSRRIVLCAAGKGGEFLSGLLCRHQTQVGGGADFSWVDKTNFFERREVLFDRHEMGGAMTGR